MPQFEYHSICCPSNMITHTSVCSGRYIAVSLNDRGNIATWNIEFPEIQPYILIGHHKIVSALAFSNFPETSYLCSCSTDNIIIWNLSDNAGKPQKGRVLLSGNEEPLSCYFSSDNSKILVSFNKIFRICDLKSKTWNNLIEDVLFTLFLYDFQSELLTYCEENVLKVWNKRMQEILTRVIISSGFPSSLCSCDKLVAVGTTCGVINVYGPNFNLIKSIEIWKLLGHFLKNNNGSSKNFSGDSFPVFATHLFSIESTKIDTKHSPSVIYLLVVTSSCIFIVNINNDDLKFYLDFTGEEMNIGLIRAAALSISTHSSECIAVLTPLISDSLVLLKLCTRLVVNCEGLQKELVSSETGCKELSNIELTFLYSGNKDDQSLLTRARNSFQKQSPKKTGLKKSSSNLSLPVTFHSTVKSSGYGIVHKPTVMFHPKINKRATTEMQHSKSLVNLHNFASSKSSYSFNTCALPFNPQKCSLLADYKFSDIPAVSLLDITADGKFVGCSSSDGIVNVLKLEKQSLNISKTMTCHKGVVSSCNWSHTGKLLITSGEDRTAKIWNLKNVKVPLLIFGMECDGNAFNTNTAKGKFVFGDAVEQTQFYYLDKFVLAASGDKIFIFDYIISVENSGLKNHINKSFLKLIQKISLDMKRITTFAAVNQFFSNLVLCTGTSKSIDVIDMTVGKVAWHKDDVAVRPPHLIAINEGSPYTSQDSTMYDLFLTSTMCDGIKIWDIRTKEVVVCYKEHQCRSLPCGATFSACGKFIFSGSEDKSIYTYDLRQLSHLHKFYDQQDVVTGIKFSPKHSQLLTASLDGRVSLYG